MFSFDALAKHLVRAVATIGLLAACTAHAADSTGVVAYGANEAAAQHFSVDGNRFYYETYGSGEPLLLIHGNGSSISAFKFQIGEFSQHYRVIAMDSRGQGKSELGTKHLTYEQMTEDSNALLEHLKLDHVKVLGWSDGGIIGLLLAIHHPDKIGMLAVMGANLNPEAAQQWALDGLVRERKKINDAIARNDKSAPWEVILQYIDLLEKQPHIPITDVAKIQVPTLVMAGDRDVIRNEHTLTIFNAIPKSQLEIFSGATHMIPQEDPARFNRKVLEFFGTPFTMPDTKDLHWFD